ncbi:hypothetical protein BDQ17DRAFT_1350935 [Cyathus striatus]|nr:hypothetical protein BDQ17DRAFT_1350935 [Cyathus striatus]
MKSKTFLSSSLDMPPRNPYKVLGISPNASEEIIKRAYKEMAFKWHPDRNQQNRDAATKRFVEVNEAYRSLVREGYVEDSVQPAAANPERPRRAKAPPPPARPPPAPTILSQPTHSNSLSSDSIHVFPSSVESFTFTTPSSSYKDGRGTPWSREQRSSQTQRNNIYSDAFAIRDNRRRESGPRNDTGSRESPQQWGKDVPNLGRQYPSSGRYGTQSTSRSRLPSRSPTPGNLRQRVPSATTPQIPPYGLPLSSIGLGPSKEWIYALPLTLEELLVGKHCCFAIKRFLLSGKTKDVVIELDVPPGCRAGTKIMCRGIGHERRDGTLQDIAFIVDEVHHERFTRHMDDLLMDIRLPWTDNLSRQAGTIPVDGLNDQKLLIHINYARDRVAKGRYIVPNAGMPIRQNGNVVGRGNMIVHWEILPPQTRVIYLMKRFFPFVKKS